MRLLMITPKLDPMDDLFGHVNGWACALARRVERLYVVALWPGRPDLPPNAHFATLGKADDELDAASITSKVGWMARLQRIVGRLCLRGEIDAVLAHMGPVFAVAAAPVARLTGRPVFLWYAHGHVSPLLRMAHLAVEGIGTSTPEGFQIPSEKVTITGQGIDLGRFRPADSWPAGERLLSVGRFSPVKQYHTLIDALFEPGLVTRTDLNVELVGGVHSYSESYYLETLRSRAKALGLEQRIRFVEGRPHAEIVPTYQRATLFATASATGSLDKVVLEAAACGLVPIVSNSAFRELFGDRWSELSFGPNGDAVGLCERIETWLERSPAERRDVAMAIRERIAREHSVDHWADSVIEMIERRLRRSR